ncbi:glycoside hydrolase family 2 TIM barrel-domain containing protein [Flavivirga algicola]|uniref:Glycoside hydrolase family 2 catalytic domain-containing protein n=1 Tax=Flavivirga algicola TaxID=2729136 RepID=A0ABX1S1H4_9FLAO|nr:glycoside hydrolase family 2 TIM barrel-domain containing protein [Flavivirga algicola]NMH89687.1 hypothetical protein [Flavivirga algicola]
MQIFNKNILLIIALVFVSCKNNSNVGAVSVSGRQILVNNTPYIIKGICYHPVPKGSTVRNFKNLTEDLALMVEAGVNTIRVYAPIDDKAILDEIHQAGLKIIIGFGYNQEGNYDILSGSFIDYVSKYKNHEAILLWELGNEYNYHPEWFEGNLENWYKTMNTAAELIHEKDSNHPVTTAHGELPDALALSLSQSIDVWGMNVYRWDDPSDIFSKWAAVSTKPMYLSEAGGDSYMAVSKNGYEQGLNENAQADANTNILDAVFRNNIICSGVAVFSFTDGWWKAGNPSQQDIGGWAPNSSGIPYDGAPNEEYWGIVDIDRNKKKTFDVIKTKYTQLKD